MMTGLDIAVANVRFDESKLYVLLTDGCKVNFSLDQYPRLRDASEADRNNWRPIGCGQGVCWEAIDEDLSVTGFLKV